MYNELMKQLVTKKILLFIGLFLVFFFIYWQIDHNAFSSYVVLLAEGYVVFGLHILLNVLMSLGSALLIGVSYLNYKMTGKEHDGSIMSVISVLFGTLTYGCTSCVIAFFASIGISFSVIALPLSNLPYKLISFILILIGMVWTKYTIDHMKCEV